MPTFDQFVSAGEDNNVPVIYWDLIDVCQYRCSYCYNMKLIKQEEYKQGLHQEAWKLALTKLQRITFDFNLAIHGGEPTLHPELATIIDSLEELPHCKSIVLSTNVTAPDELYKQFDRKNSKLSIHMSYHPEYHRKIFDKIVRIANSIEHINIWVEAILFPRVEYYSQMIEFLENIKQSNITYYVSAANNTLDYNHTADAKFKEIFDPYIRQSKSSQFKHVTAAGDTVMVPEHQITGEQFSYKGWRCQALSYTIGVDGTIINNCTKQRLPIIIKETDVKKFVTCPQADTCYCSEMFNYKKYKND